jgi:small neutral amino acid transporter SnatA (MarC family)
MTLALLLVTAVAVVDAPRARACLPTGDRVVVAALGAAVTLLALLTLALVTDPLLEAVAVPATTARIAAGVLVAVTGVVALVGRFPAPEPALTGRWAALVPVAFPTLFTPALAALAVAGSADHGAATTGLVLLVALATVPLVAPTPVGATAPARALDGVARLLAAGATAAGVALVVDGVFDL